MKNVNNQSNTYALNAKNKPCCRSCIMVTEQLFMDDFFKLGIKKVNVYKNGAYVVDIPVGQMDNFVKLYCRLMQPGYWNEYLGPKTGFFFKKPSGLVKHFRLTPNNIKNINLTMREFIPNWSLDTDLWDWLANVEIYSGWIKS